MHEQTVPAPYGYDVRTHTEVTPKPAPTHLVWHLGLVVPKTHQPDAHEPSGAPPDPRSTITMQLTADQQVDLSIDAHDAYGNEVPITGDVTWLSSDEAIISVVAGSDPEHATAVAVGPAGTASVTVTNDVDRDGTGDFMGSLAIDVVAGDIAEITVVAGEATDKPSQP